MPIYSAASSSRSSAGASASASRASSRRRRVGGGGGEARLQPVAQRHQLIDLGDDAVLFGEGWNGIGSGLSFARFDALGGQTGRVRVHERLHQGDHRGEASGTRCRSSA